jgi:hypothetical protein
MTAQKKRKRNRTATSGISPDKQRIPSEPGLWDRIPKVYQHVICLFILFLLPFFQYGDVMLGDQKFMSPDIVQWRASAESIIDYRENYDEEALWSENMFSGMPAYIVSYKRSVPHLDQLFTWLAPIFPAAALWVMMIGMYLFLLRLKLHPLAAVTGALLVALTTYMPIIVGAGHNAKVYALAFIPWMFWGYMMLTRSPRRLLGFGIFALATTLELRTGHPQVGYFFLYVFAIWWAVDIYNAYRNQLLPQWLSKTGLLIGAGLLALGANAQPYWSIYEYTPYSIRGGNPAEERSGLDLDYAMAWSHGWFEMTSLAIPGILGGSSTDNMYWGAKSVTSGPHYIGAAAWLLILLALFNARYGVRWVFLGGAVLSMLFALGENLLWFNELFFNYMPFFNKFRAPEKWLMVTAFCLSTLAAFGAQWLFDKQASGTFTGSLRKLDWPAGLVIGFGVLMLILVNTSLDYEKPGERSMLARQVAQQNNVDPNDPRVMEVVNDFLQTTIDERQSLAQSDTLRYLFFAGIAVVLIAVFLLAKLPAYLALAGILLLLSFDLITTGNRYIPDESKVSEQLSQRDVMEQQRRGYHDFIQQELQDEVAESRVFPLGQNPFNNARPSYFYPSLGGYTGAKMSRYQQAIDNAFFAGPAGINLGLLNMLDVRFVTVQQAYGFPGYNTVYDEDDGIVLENTRSTGRVFFPESVEAAVTSDEALAFISNGRLSAAEASVVEKQSSALLPHQADPEARFELLEYSAREIRISIDKTVPGYVGLSEIYYPQGWKAFLNGEEVPVYAMNYLLRSVYVEEGQHELRMAFNPVSHTLGSSIAWGFNILILLITAFGAYIGRGKQIRTDDSDDLNTDTA